MFQAQHGAVSVSQAFVRMTFIEIALSNQWLISFECPCRLTCFLKLLQCPLIAAVGKIDAPKLQFSEALLVFVAVGSVLFCSNSVREGFFVIAMLVLVDTLAEQRACE